MPAAAIAAPRSGDALERTWHVIVLVDSTTDLIARPVRATSPLEARRKYLREMSRSESIVRIDGPIT